MISAQAYSITVRQLSIEDEECYEGRVIEFPDILEYADTPEEARALIIDAIETTQDILVEKEKEIPQPSSILDDNYSGRVTLRMPKQLHKNMALSANQDGTSLNQYMVFLLSFSQGYTSSVSHMKNSMESIQNSIDELKEKRFSIDVHYKIDYKNKEPLNSRINILSNDQQWETACLFST